MAFPLPISVDWLMYPALRRRRKKKCDFDSAGKVLHQMRQKIAALSAPKATLKLVTGFSDPHCGQIAASSDRGSRRRAWPVVTDIKS